MAASSYDGYQPLDAAERQIRLVKIWWSSENHLRLHGALQTASLKDDRKSQPAQYYALSWYWGMPGRNKQLVLDGSLLQIRENLYYSMLALTRHIGDALIWIDAICIDQHNEVEKSTQVTMMAEIHQNARAVIAWLGEGDADFDLAFESSKYRNRSRIQVGDLAFSLQDQYQSFRTIFSRPYWTRVWTLQERAFATHL
jgi:Heterokaryon incompatibility protein (HET)